MVKFNFEYKKKKFSLEVLECRSVFEKMKGLMFRKKSKPLLFIFNRLVNEPIHSFFCVPFIAIWFNDNKIVDFKFILPFRPYIVPKKSFNKFLEIPINNNNFLTIKSVFNL
ncbi:MAG: hypothetical protein WC402_01690 [Candidatus Pacearchaeota archaeon]|jgi:uncharacterized membrane protein (UPF0127 family)